MSPNKRTVERYMAAFRRGEHAEILACLTDDVEWLIPGAVHARGKEAFDREVRNEDFTGTPDITVARLVEEAGVVVAEGTVRARQRDGAFVDLAFCDVFEMRGGLVGRLTSYLVPLSSPPAGGG